MKISTDGYSVRDIEFWDAFSRGRANDSDAEKIVLSAIEAGVNLNQGDKNGETPLMKAVINGYFGFIKALIEHGADLEYASVNHRTALVLAVDYDRIEIIRYLIDAGAEVNPPVQTSPLVSSVYNSYASTEILLEAGAHVDHQSVGGMTAVACAAISNNLHSLNLLIRYKANLEIEGSLGRTPLLAAAQKHNLSCIAALLDAGAVWRDEYNKKIKPSVINFVLKRQAIKIAEEIGSELHVETNKMPKVRL